MYTGRRRELPDSIPLRRLLRLDHSSLIAPEVRTIGFVGPARYWRLQQSVERYQIVQTKCTKRLHVCPHEDVT